MNKGTKNEFFKNTEVQSFSFLPLMSVFVDVDCHKSYGGTIFGRCRKWLVLNIGPIQW